MALLLCPEGTRNLSIILAPDSRRQLLRNRAAWTFRMKVLPIVLAIFAASFAQQTPPSPPPPQFEREACDPPIGAVVLPSANAMAATSPDEKTSQRIKQLFDDDQARES